MRIILLVLAATVGFSSLAVADPWKDESGKHKWRNSYGWQDDWSHRGRERHHGRYRADKIPYGHLPPPGECRTWYRGVPPGHQPPPYRC